MSFPQYREYTDSGLEWLGKAPTHWKVRKVSYDFTAVKGPRGATLTKEYCSTNPGRYPVYSGQTENAGVLGSIDNFDFSLGSNGGLLTTTVGAKAMSLTFVVGNISLSQNCMLIRPLSKNVFIKFYFYHLQPLFRLERGMIPDHMQPSFRMEDLYCFYMALPLLQEQTQIARFLDHETAKIDALIQEQKRLIELLKEKRQAEISHAVIKGLDPDVPMKDSGVEWLGEIPAHWGNVKLKHLVFEKVAGPYGSSLTKSMYVSSGYKVYGQQQVISDDFALGDYYISEEKFKELKRHEIHADDVLVSVMGTVGRVSVVPEEHEPGIINPRLVRYRFDQRRVLPQFIKAVLMSYLYQAKLSEASQGTTMEGLNMVILGEMPIVLPTVTEQQKIAETVDSENSGFNKAISGSRDLVSLLQERRSALISAAVTGKIDVRNWQPPADESAFEEVARDGQEATV